jgi:hypothetical protein
MRIDNAYDVQYNHRVIKDLWNLEYFCIFLVREGFFDVN